MVFAKVVTSAMSLTKKGRSKKKAKVREKIAQVVAFTRLSPVMQAKVVAGMKVAAEHIRQGQA